MVSQYPFPHTETAGVVSATLGDFGRHYLMRHQIMHWIASMIDSGEIDTAKFKSVEEFLTFYTSKKGEVEMYRAEAVIPGHPMKVNDSKFMRSWRYRQRNSQKWKKLVFEYFYNQRPPKPLERFNLTCIWYGPREPDFDNLVLSFKPAVDGLIHAGIIKDDKRSMMIADPSYLFEKVPMKSKNNPIPDYKIKIIVEGE